MNLNQIAHGLNQIDEIAKILNDIARTESIPRDNKQIWDRIHGMSMEDWAAVYAALGVIKELEPGSFTESDERAIGEAAEAWDKADKLGKDFVGTPYQVHKGNKNAAWQTYMRIREIVNRMRGVYIPNGPQTRVPPRRRPESRFGELFQ